MEGDQRQGRVISARGRVISGREWQSVLGEGISGSGRKGASIIREYLC